MSLLVKSPSIPHNTMKRNSRSLDLSEIIAEPTNNATRRQHQRSTSDGMTTEMVDKAPEDRKQSAPSVSRGSYLPLFKTGPFKNLVHRSSSPTQRFSVAISSPTNNPELAATMNPLNQKSPPTTPSATLRKPTLPVGLQQEINRFAIDGFAQKFFATHKRGLFRKRVPVKEMLKWTKESLRQPLIMMNKDLYKDGLRCFKWIQMIMGDRSRPRNSSEVEDIQNVLTCGITKGQMRDEIYVQVCKQLNENPQTVTFPPSKNLEDYLNNFVKQHFSSGDEKIATMSRHVSNKLKRVCKRGAKGKVLTVAEIARAKEAPFRPSVFGESLSLIMDLQQSLDPTVQIPMIVPFLASTVRATHGYLSEGIFRIPGDADAVTDLRVRIENGNYNAEGITDPNVPASLLKYWLRDLADPIITSEHYYDCIQYAEDAEKAVAIINQLPDTNRRIALFIISFLQEFNTPDVISHTLMNVNNLAMVFAPNFLRCPSESLTTVFENSKYEQAFLRTLINQIKIDPSLCTYEPDPSQAMGTLQ
ncbi:Rho GTPase activation protein [Sporodiniella umbellata]|nr:Rho GTPase activation protein [Sporodiniella umbellata]